MSPHLVVITVNYCCAREILANLPETVRQLQDIGNAEFWIVDNKSPDGSAADLIAGVDKLGLNDWVKIIQAPVNGGFGAGNNIAIRQGLFADDPVELFYFLNPDAVPKPGAIAAFVDFMTERPDVGIAGGLLCDENGNIESSLFKFPSFWSEVEHGIALNVVRKLLKKHVTALPTPSEPTSVDWVAGTSFITRRAAFEKAGLFDETFFLYWEEIELCHRVKSSGFEIFAIPSVVVEHTGGVSTGMHQDDKRFPKYWFESRHHFFKTTGLVRNTTVLNVGVALAWALRRLHHGVRGRKHVTPHFLRDLIKYSFLTPKEQTRP